MPVANELLKCFLFLLAIVGSWTHGRAAWAEETQPRPNVILMMADDQGWGETSYNDHPRLKTPNLDRMAANGLRFDCFYAAAPVCSPTRASVLTGRSNNRTGVESHGFALRLQEKTVAKAMRDAGYRTGHFGKWHLNGLRGPGVPVLASDDHNPGVFGFEEWLSVTNFFDRDPILGRRGEFEEFRGDSSEIVVDEALKFIQGCVQQQEPFFTVIWFGTPHSPFRANEEDRSAFEDLDDKSMHHYGELVALDRSVGTLRKQLRKLGVHQNTLFWYCSDNGGLSGIEPSTVKDLRGHKGSIYEGGLRVPCVVEWPSVIEAHRTAEPAVVMDIFPTLVEACELPKESMMQPQDGTSLLNLFQGGELKRNQVIPFNCFGETAIIDGNLKLLHVGIGRSRKNLHYELYDLENDPSESNDLSEASPELVREMRLKMDDWLISLQRSVDGKDYPEGVVNSGEPEPRFWNQTESYAPYFADWRDRPEYQRWLRDK
ncbi:MAG: sulfatase-like hydrolase/transferase [Planctomycetota bacterium]